jgi:DNA-binding GntR family transcriptional regulator
MTWKTIMNKEEAYEELRVRIITNGVVPGEILKEKDLMAQLAIGRSPLREILFRLQEENLIKPPGIGGLRRVPCGPAYHHRAAGRLARHHP